MNSIFSIYESRKLLLKYLGTCLLCYLVFVQHIIRVSNGEFITIMVPIAIYHYFKKTSPPYGYFETFLLS